jgi:hypothetical protein
VLVTPGYDNNSTHPGLLEGLQDFKPEMLHGTPFHDYYLATAPRPEDFPRLVEKKVDMDRHYPDHPKSAIEGLAAPVLLVAGDSDIVRNDYVVEFFGLLGGNVRRRHGRPAGLAARDPARHHAPHRDPPARAALDRPGVPRRAGEGVAALHFTPAEREVR